MKRAAYRHPKMLDLASRLAIPRTQAIGIVEVLLDYTAEAAPQGNIGKWPDGAIAEACDWDGDPTIFVGALVEAGWLDRCARHRLVVHDLAHHAQSWWVAKLKKLGIDFVTAATSVRARRKAAPNKDDAKRSEKPLKSTSEGDEKPLKSTSEPSSFPAFPSLPPPSPALPSQAPSAALENIPASPEVVADKPVAVKKPRERDPLFDAIAEVTASDPKASGSHIAKVAKSLREAEPPYTPEEVRRWASQAKPWGGERFPSLPQIEKEIGRIRAGPAPSLTRGLGGIAASLQAKAQGGKLNLDRTEDRHGD